MRSRLPVTHDSMREWLSRPEWAYLVAFLHEAETDALASLMAADPNDSAAVARAQTQVRFVRSFTQGEIEATLKGELATARPS